MSVKNITKENVKKEFCDGVKAVVVGIVFAIVATLMSTYIQNKIDNRNEIEHQIKSISNIYIGCSKSWVDENFGAPNFISSDDKYVLCAYVSDYFVVQIVFDKAESACAYLVTALSAADEFSIKINDLTFLDESFSNLTLGEFTYYSFPKSPMNVLGFITNGAGRYMYAEQYYYNSGGAYYEYYIATLDYGIGIENAKFEYGLRNTDVDDEVTQDMVAQWQITNRNECTPNSYGVSKLDFENFESLLFDYSRFNSQQLRNKYHPDILK